MMENDHEILINAKWHRISTTPPYIMTLPEADRLIDALTEFFRTTADTIGN